MEFLNSLGSCTYDEPFIGLYLEIFKKGLSTDSISHQDSSRSQITIFLIICSETSINNSSISMSLVIVKVLLLK